MQPERSPLNSKLNSRLKLILGIVLLVALAIAIKVFNVQALLQNALLWVKSLGVYGAIAFILLYNIATVLLIPGSLLTLGGGAIFGLMQGSIYVFIAATLGATFAFLIGRYLSRDWVAKQIENNAKFKAIDEAVAKEGFKIVLLTRLSPIFPFNLLNYAFGITQVSLKDYVLGSIGMIPGTILYVYIGSLAGDLTRIDMGEIMSNAQTQSAQWVARGIGLAATIAVTIYISRIAQKVLGQSIAVEESDE
jgi:uncharacterized membrane protein YdjX (TVP38/TMEM64 family)